MARNRLAMDHFSKNLTYLLNKHKMSAKELAIKTGITPKSISEWMNAHAVPKQESVDKIAKAFKLPSDALISYQLEPSKDLSEISIGDRITRLRAAKGYTIKDLAERAHIDRVNLGKVESNDIHPRPDTLHKLSKALGVSVDLLLANETVKQSLSEDPESKRQHKLLNLVSGRKYMLEFLLLALADESSLVFQEYMKFANKL